MSIKRTIIAGLFTVGLIAILFYFVTYIGTYPSVKLKIQPDATLTEALALDLSKQALIELKLFEPDLKPKPFSDGSFFTKAAPDSQTGYSTWFMRDDKSRKCHVVRITLYDGFADAFVSDCM